MRYTLLLHYPEMTPEELGEEAMEQGRRAFHAYADALRDAGVLISAEVLDASSSTSTIRRRNGKLEVQDGPYVESKEQLGGTFVIDVPDLDAALAWAEKCPAAEWGAIEVRPSLYRYEEGTWVTA